jgi:transcriptional regulator with PAS, ATPase and Fis domain
MGERGIGKTRIAKKTNMNDKNFITANCASFADDTMAESELFGYEKGAFTGALKEGKSGLFADANGGILFLDEIHNLSKSVQAKLMTALQTEKGGTMNVRKFGSNQSTPVKCRLIFATNRNIEDLKKCLLPDFYDRIVQHVVEMPPLRLSPEERENDWKSTWEYLFSEIQSEMPEVPTKETDPELIIWLTKQPLNGNWRDLEKIAMYYNAYNQFNEETTEMLKEKTAFQYAKNEFEKYHSHIEPDKKNIGFDISSEKSADEMTKDFHFQLYEWAIKKWSRKDAAEKLNVSEKTLNNWKNRK